MSLRPFRDIKRRKTKVINVGNVKIGGDNPISVQSMTNTLTTDVKATIKQINDIAEEGADIVRVSCPDEDSSKALKEIIKHVSIPVVADIHFHYKRAIEAAENGASCLRINPGNIGDETKIHEVLKAAKNNNCSIRIGVNAGSLEKDILEEFKEPCPEALVKSALRNIKILEDKDFLNFKISVKSSDVFLSIAAYRQLSKVIDYPLHLGITEAGSFVSGSIKSSIGLGSLLMDGIGDTIRISLSDNPTQEVKIGNEILKSLNLRNRGVKIISCPSCARQAFQVIDTVKILEEKLAHIKTPITLSIIGCVVNGPGEAAMTDIGITGGGLLSEPMSRMGANVTGIDASDKNIKIAKLHSKKNKLKINYLCSSPEKLKIEKKFDVILNMEIVEHVEDIDFFLKSCSKLLKKNGLMFVATINKTLKSYVFAIVGAEYVLRWLPIGTHEWEKFVKPEDLKKILMKYDLSLNKLEGMNFNIFKDEWSISKDLSVNYIAKFIKY